MQQAAEMSLFESGAKELSLAAYDSGDTPLGNVGLTLYQDTNNNNALDAGDVAIGTTTTSITGNRFRISSHSFTDSSCRSRSDAN